MTVLLLRPDRTLSASLDAFRSARIDVIGIPLIVIQDIPLSRSRLIAWLERAASQSVCIFTSQNAVQPLMSMNIAWPGHVSYIAVGPSTADALARMDIKAELPDGYHSEGLLKLAALQHGNQRQALIFKGEGGRPLLPQTLKKRGFEVTELGLYRRTTNVDLPEFDKRNITCVIATSGELVESAFRHYDQDWLKSLPWIVVSERTATIAEDCGITNYRISDGANDSALISCVHQFLE